MGGNSIGAMVTSSSLQASVMECQQLHTGASNSSDIPTTVNDPCRVGEQVMPCDALDTAHRRRNAERERPDLTYDSDDGAYWAKVLGSLATPLPRYENDPSSIVLTLT